MAKKKNNTNKKKKNAEKKKKNTMASSTSNPTISADSSSPIEGGAKQESPAVAVSTSSERKSSQELVMKLGPPPSTWFEPGLMFAKNLDSADSDPELNRAAIVVYSDEMKRALSLTEEFKNIPYIRVFARDKRNRGYELRFSRNDDVQQGNEFILHHEWGKMVAENGLKEGHAVLGFGYNRFIGNQFRVLLRFLEEPPPENQREAVCFLFEKRMDGAADLKQPTIECCTDKLKMALQLTPWRPYIRVFATVLPMGKRYEMSFKRRDGEGSFTLCSGWEDIVAEIGVEEGDLVTGTGKILNHAIRMQLYFIKNIEEETTSNRFERAVLFFEKKLESPDTDALVGRLVIRSCKDVVKQGIDQELEAEGNNNGYVRVSAIDAKGYMYDDLRLSRCTPQEGEGDIYVVDHQWGGVVTANGLRSGDKVWCWGCFIGDGSIQMKIDVDKALEL